MNGLNFETNSYDEKSFIVLFLFFSLSSYGQTVLEWDDLTAGINLKMVAVQGIFPEFQPATFNPKMEALDGKKVTITGYFLVLDSQQSRFMLSKNPMASCFFCGNGGPETVMDLKFAKKQLFEMDEVLSVEGILRLNEDNPEFSYYIIEKAQAFSFN